MKLFPSHTTAALRAVALLAPALGFPLASPAANLSVDATRSVRTVDGRVFGVNMVIWDQAGSTPQTINLLQAADLRALRFPGGSLSDTYVWSQNKSYDTTTGMLNTWTWATNFDQFATVVTGLNPRPQVFITVNYGSGTPQLAANWVINANITKALGIKYWEIGNECYGNWEYDTHTPKNDPYTYAVAARDYILQMKAVDPTIKVGVVAVTGEDTYANNTNHPASNLRTGAVHNGWTPVMLTTLRMLGVTPDFLIYHRYEQTPGQESDAALLQDAATWPSDAANLRQQLSDYLGAAGAAVELVVTENNSVYSDPGKQTTSLVNGLFLADSTGNLLQTEFNALTWWAFRNGPPTDANGNLVGNQSASLYGWRLYGDYGVMSTVSPKPTQFGSNSYYEAYPTYYVMKLLSHFARGGDTVVAAASDNNLLSLYAAKRTDGSLALLVINKSPTATQTGNITLTGYSPAPTATVYSYGIPQDDAARTGVGSTDVASTTLTNASPGFAASFAPYSASVLVLTPATVSITTQPASQVVAAGQNAIFSVAVGGGAATYQWQRQAAGSSTWASLSDSSTYSGSATATLTVAGVTAAMNGDSYRCVISGGSATSAAAMLAVPVPLLVSTLAGQAGAGGSADGTGTAARFLSPNDVAVDSAGNVYVADTQNNVIRKITAAGVVTTLAGQAGVTGHADGTGTAATFNHPSGIAVDAAGSLYVADTLSHTIRSISAGGNTNTIAGLANSAGATNGTGSAARFFGPQGLALDGSNGLYVADTNNGLIRRVGLVSGAVTTVAGVAGTGGSADGFGTGAQFLFPSGVAVDSAGNLFVADTDNSTLRQITPAGAVTTVAGHAGVTGSADGSGDAARFNFPTGIAVDNSGNIYVADTNNHTVRAAVVPAAPIIAAQPMSQTVTAGSSVQFSVTASGRPSPTYQWSLNGTAIAGATSASYSIANAQAANAGDYTVTISNSVGSVTSSKATLTVNAAPSGGGGSGGGGGGGGGGPMGPAIVLALALLAAIRGAMTPGRARARVAAEIRPT